MMESRKRDVPHGPFPGHQRLPFVREREIRMARPAMGVFLLRLFSSKEKGCQLNRQDGSRCDKPCLFDEQERD